MNAEIIQFLTELRQNNNRNGFRPIKAVTIPFARALLTKYNN